MRSKSTVDNWLDVLRQNGIQLKSGFCLLTLMFGGLLAGFGSASAQTNGTWGSDADGNWSSGSSWTSGNIATGIGATATFSLNLAANRTVTVDAGRTIGNLYFADTASPFNSWTLTGGGLTLAVSSGAPTINVGASTTVWMSTILSGTSGFTKTGSGTLIMNAANDYTGTTTVSSGVLMVQNSSGLGATGAGNGTVINGTITGANSGRMSFANNVTVAENIALNYDTTGATGETNFSSALVSDSGNNTISGAVTLGRAGNTAQTVNYEVRVNGGNLTMGAITGNLASGATAGTSRLFLTPASGTTLTMGGAITNGNSSVAVLVNGAGTGAVVMTNTNSNYASGTAIRSGTLIITGDALASGTTGVLGNGTSGSIAFGDGGSSAGSAVAFLIQGGYTMARDFRMNTINGGGSCASYTLGGTTADVSTFSGTITYSPSFSASANNANFILTAASGGRVNFTGVIPVTGGTGVASITKTGSGTVALSGNSNTYTGGTTVGQGALLVNNTLGSGTGAGAVTVSNGGTLGGTGYITPQGSAGLSVVSGGIVAPGDGGIGTLTVNLGSTTGISSFAAGAIFSFDLGTTAGSSDLLAFSGLTAALADVQLNGNVVNFTNTGGIAEGLYTLFTFDADNAYSGTLTVGTGLGSLTGEFIYNAGSIQLNVIPEPDSMQLVVVAFLGVGLLIRRKNSYRVDRGA